MYCAISGEIPEVPVFSPKSGHIFERRLVEKHISEHGTCPISGEPLSIDDLQTIQVNTAVKPRAPSATSIPSMLALFQMEWDTLMLETFELKKQLQSTRQELAHALYQCDSAVKVIARVIKERDEARDALLNFKPSAGAVAVATTSKASSDQPMEIAAEEEAESENIQSPTSLEQSIVNVIKTTGKNLVAYRKNREISKELPSKEQISTLALVNSRSGVHGGRGSGIQAMEICDKLGYIATAGSDKSIILSTVHDESVLATLKGHGKKITSLRFNESGSVLASSSEDKTVKIWTSAGDDSVSYSESYSLKVFKDVVREVDFHPSNAFFMASSLDSTFAFIDPSCGEVLAQSVKDQVANGFTCGKFHPDGMILGLGANNSAVRVYDSKTLKQVADFTGHAGKISSLSFSENGYHMISASEDGTVKLWDLRNLKNAKTLELEGVTSVSFDHSGTFMALGGIFGARVGHVKQWEILAQLEDNEKAITQVSFTRDSQTLISAGLDNAVRFYQPSSN